MRTSTVALLAFVLKLGLLASLLTSDALGQRPPEAADCQLLPRRIPPVGLKIPTAQNSAWQRRLTRLSQRANQLPSAIQPDIEVLLKACRFAIEFRELYRESDFDKVDRLLDLAHQRLDDWASQQTPWTEGHGRQVRGFRSSVDGSTQPLGLLLPKQWQTSNQPLPLYVWLHGRGDKTTDLHFICDRLDRDGQIVPENAFVLHPFGRQCIGYKSAGETDVLEAIDFVIENYPIDTRRIVLMGFSMGGAGVWHLAAHYTDRFVAASPGAGFAETARYQRLSPADYPPEYEQILWRHYDVPAYVRNLFNIEVVAYSGENDKQIQAARVMEEAYQDEGRILPHLIGPGMGHKYHPDTLADILQRMTSAASQGQTTQPRELHLQTRHWRYTSRAWLQVDGFHQPYEDTRVDARRIDSTGNHPTSETTTGKSPARSAAATWQITTQNVKRLVIDLSHPQLAGVSQLVIDGQPISIQSPQQAQLLLSSTLTENNHRGAQDMLPQWRTRSSFPQLRKHPGLSGPIDDAFLDPFLIVTPSGSSQNSQVDRWVECELKNQLYRWRSLFRGEPRVKVDAKVTAEDMQKYHLVIWGTPESNSLLRKMTSNTSALAGDQNPSIAHRLPLVWNPDQIQIAGEIFDSQQHVPALIFPNPMHPERYLVLNSGPTFRPAHDRTNSLQNPHLPDWVVIGLDALPSVESPGRIARTGFFDDNWSMDKQLQWP